MPDWSYRTVLRPALFALPPRAGRDLALGVMGRLGRAWAGRALIDLLGHMRAADALRTTRRGVRFPSPIGFGGCLDPHLRATEALGRFGVGFVEVGPFAITPVPGARVDRDDGREALVFDASPEMLPIDAAADRLTGIRSRDVPILVRLDPAGDDGGLDAVVARLAPLVSGFTIAAGDAAWTPGRWNALAARVAGAAGAPVPLFLVVDGAASDTGRIVIGRSGRESARATLVRVRADLGADVAIIAGGGVHEPQDARDVLAAGADLVLIDSGLVFGGPGLPKRINEALQDLHSSSGESSGDSPDDSPEEIAESAWGWLLLCGVGMLIGAVMALVVAAGRVVLPYDEQFVGLSRHELAAFNPHLLPFLTHDRVTLAGAMVAIGTLYTGLAWFGVRRGRHWAQVAIVTSALVGFASFFLFLGFGYFDPFHAFVTAILFQLLLMGIHGRVPRPHALPPPMLVEDGAWRLGLWGQLGLVVQGIGFLGAGLIIAALGITQVFVHEDLEFLETTPAALLAVKPHLVPLVAHDRATLGGMLTVAGLAILLTALWGFRPGERWLWWTLLLAGIPGYAAAIGVHYAVGYQNAFHLAPAFLGLGIFATALAASYPSLCRR